MVVPREYQINIANKILESGENTLVVLPTGLGKTLIAALVARGFFERGKGKVIFLAPTRPLVFQHARFLADFFGTEVAEVTGDMKKEERKKIYEEKIVVSTPQCVKNDIENFGKEIFDFSLVVFDEAHRAVGKYAYTFVASVAREKGALIVGLTASPGGKFEKIKETMDALFIDRVEIRSETEEDVKKYIQPITIKWVKVTLPEQMKKACEKLEEILKEKKETLKELGIKVAKDRKKLSEIYKKLAQEKNLAALSHFSQYYAALHGIELIQTQGPAIYKNFIDRLQTRKKRLDPRFTQAKNLMYEEKEKMIEHPKFEKLIEIIKEKTDKKIIVFAQYRDTVNYLENALKEFGAAKLVGKKEMKASEQKKVIEEFQRGKNILICSSVGEEGIDIPAADVVIFYEPIPSEIRTIQRRGRVGRIKGGEVIILFTEDTLDETFRYVSLSRERKMKKILTSFRSKKEKQPKITDFL